MKTLPEAHLLLFYSVFYMVNKIIQMNIGSIDDQLGSGGIIPIPIFVPIPIPIPSGSGPGSRTLLGRDRDRDPEHCLDGIGIGTGLVCLE